MRILSSDRIAFAQGLYNDNRHDVLNYIRKYSVGVDKIAMVCRTSESDPKITICTFWFKGHNGEHVVRYTYLMDVT